MAFRQNVTVKQNFFGLIQRSSLARVNRILSPLLVPRIVEIIVPSIGN